MKKKILIYVNSGHCFTSDIITELTDDQIFHEILGGMNKLITVGKMTFMKDQISAVVIDDMKEELRQEPCHLTATSTNSNESMESV